MRIIVTRPAFDAQRWVTEFARQGLEALALPLIKVGPVAQPAALLQAWAHLADYVGVMFVSSNAVAHFFALKPPSLRPFDAGQARPSKAWATGPGTARALLHEGLKPEQMIAPPLNAAQFDSEALWQQVGEQVQAGDRVLIVRGGDSETGAGQGVGREWFASRIRQAGAQPEFVVAYQRSAPDLSPLQAGLAKQAASDGSVWLFSSSEALTHLCTALPAQSWAQARAVVTHPRIGAAARQAGFGVVCESRPALSDLVASIELMR